jgi:hypothetical protein
MEVIAPRARVRRASNGVHVCLEHELPAPDLSLSIELIQMDGGTTELRLEQGSRVQDLKGEIERQIGGKREDMLLYVQDGRLLTNERDIVKGPTVMLVVAPTEQDILLEGLKPGTVRSDYMGIYEFVAGEEVNGCPVYKAQSAQGSKNSFLYKATRRWMIGDQECMRDASKNNYGYVKTEDDCARPDEITVDWSIVNSDGRWDSAPSIKARLCTGAEKMVALQRLQDQEHQARLQSLNVGAMSMMGHKPEEDCDEHTDEHFERLLGVYYLHASSTSERNAADSVAIADAAVMIDMMNEHPVYCKQTDEGPVFIYWSSMGGWWVSDEADYREGKASGWLYNTSVTLTPNLATSAWRLSRDTQKDWLATGFADAEDLKVATQAEGAAQAEEAK